MVEKLLTKLRAKDYRAAYRAIPQLCRLDDGSLAGIVASYKPKDDQRRFQFEVARIALAEKLAAASDSGLAATVGKIAILYRAREEKSKIKLPK